MSFQPRVLITGIGCVGKSTLRKRVAEAFGNQVVCVDRDDAIPEPEVAPNQVLVVESVHGLDEPPERWGLVIYLLPPSGHSLRWIRRGLIWFRTGQVDRPPRALRKPWSLGNIPLIIRLIVRNIWNASSWVGYDLKSIEALFPETALVSANADLAFNEVERFILKELEEGNNMSANDEVTEKDMKEWVKKSIELDLVYDEEQGKEKISECIPKGFNVPLEPSDEIEPLPKDLEIKDIRRWFEYFFKLKTSRIYYDLKFDNSKSGFANSDSNYRYDNVCKAHKSRNNILDGIMWNCAAAISVIRVWKPEEAEIKKRDTLIALFHSELCASATPDVSWAQAQVFYNINLVNAFDYKLFAWVARHNLARGYNHLRSPEEAAKKIDKFVDKYLGIQKYIELVTDIKSININILYRAIIFPATLTLSQALGDLRRYAESRYYLKRALDEVNNAKEKIGLDYWKIKFELLLAKDEKNRGRPITDEQESLLENDTAFPRIENLRKDANTSYLENNASPKEIELWKKHEISVLKWHSAEHRPFSQHLETMAKNIEKILSDLPNKDENALFVWLINYARRYYTCRNILEVFETAELYLNKLNKYPIHHLVKFEKDDKKLGGQTDLTSLWMQGKALFEVLREFNPQLNNCKISSSDFKIWENNLKNLLESKVVEQFRSEAIKAKILKEDQKPKDYKNRECLVKSKKEKCQLSCHEQAFFNDDSIGDPHFDPLRYYYNVMSAQQERFLNYLKYRTGRDRHYQQGEAVRQSPDFEIICLRRWNSFSPNLGSRAAMTVGGGYLVRAWDNKAERYIGIAIDPGYNFLENLFNEGFTIPDIDLIVITHTHPDHIENFTNFLTLLREREERMKEENKCYPRISPKDHHILLAMTEGVFERFRRHLDDEKDFIRDIAVLTAKHDREKKKNHLLDETSRGSEAGKEELNLGLDKNYVCHMDLRDGEQESNKAKSTSNNGNKTSFDCKVILRAKRAWHHDGTDHDTIGLIIEYCTSGRKPMVGIIGDSRYNPELYEDYKDCDILVTHLGGLVDENMYKDSHKNPDILKKKIEEFNIKSSELIARKNHLYLPGLTLLICDLQKNSKKFPLMILSEFGEELRGGLRKDLARRLSYRSTQKWAGNPLHIIPGDVGLRIDIDSHRVFCCICNRYEKPENIQFETVMPDEESMGYICKDCMELRKWELTALLEQWCQTARPVVPLEYNEKSDGKKESKAK